MKLYMSMQVLRIFIPLAVVATILAGLVYIVGQQNIRQNGNDPQIQIAEDFAAHFSTGQPVTQFNPSLNVDIAKSLSTYILVYDNEGKIIAGSGRLNGQYPDLPKGVFDYVKTFGEDRISWQPQPDVRSALVITRFENTTQSGFVVVGRSMREIERRVQMVGWYVFVAWLAALVASLIVIIGLEFVLP